MALIRSDDYWRDAPGESSMQFNYELVAHGFHIHRLFIIDEFFWPRGARTPSKQLFHWILEQYQRGLVTYTTVLESQRQAFDAESLVVQLKNQRLQNRIALFLSLGGEFTIPE